MDSIFVSRFRVSDVLRCHRMRIFKRLGTPFSDPIPHEFQKLSEKRNIICESIYKAYSKRKSTKISCKIEDTHRKGVADIISDGKAYIIRLAQPSAITRKRTDMRHLAQIVTCMMMSQEKITDGSIIYITEKRKAQIVALSSLTLSERQKLKDLVKRDWDILIKQWYESILPPAKPVQQWECDYCLYRKACREGIETGVGRTKNMSVAI